MPWDVSGHAWAVESLRGDIVSGRLAHAYLFTGPAGIGKRTLALAFARALSCTQPPEPGIPCGTCRPCTQIAAQTHPDLAVVRPEEPDAQIKVEAARSLIHLLSLSPLELKRRIGLLPDFELANPSAANALLKTLEEPPASALLLLTAESAEVLLPTIVSRCRVVGLRPLPLAEVEQALTARWGVDPARARLLAHLSGGRLGWAVETARNPELLADRAASFARWKSVFAQSRGGRLELAYEISRDRAQARQVLQAWMSFAHDLLLSTLDEHASLTNLDFESEIRMLAGRTPAPAAQGWLAALRHADAWLDRNVNLRLALEAALLQAPRLQGGGAHREVP